MAIETLLEELWDLAGSAAAAFLSAGLGSAGSGTGTGAQGPPPPQGNPGSAGDGSQATPKMSGCGIATPSSAPAALGGASAAPAGGASPWGDRGVVESSASCPAKLSGSHAVRVALEGVGMSESVCFSRFRSV